MSFIKIVNQHDLENNSEGEIMFWASIVCIKIIDSFNVDECIKIKAENYFKSLDKMFFE